MNNQLDSAPSDDSNQNRDGYEDLEKFYSKLIGAQRKRSDSYQYVDPETKVEFVIIQGQKNNLLVSMPGQDDVEFQPRTTISISSKEAENLLSALIDMVENLEMEL